jgi:hypothetical protein
MPAAAVAVQTALRACAAAATEERLVVLVTP